MKCVVCDGKVTMEDVESRKVERLREADKSLENEEIKKAVCDECGHAAYIRDN